MPTLAVGMLETRKTYDMPTASVGMAPFSSTFCSSNEAEPHGCLWKTAKYAMMVGDEKC
jgi:hypothetical protein